VRDLLPALDFGTWGSHRPQGLRAFDPRVRRAPLRREVGVRRPETGGLPRSEGPGRGWRGERGVERDPRAFRAEAIPAQLLVFGWLLAQSGISYARRCCNRRGGFRYGDDGARVWAHSWGGDRGVFATRGEAADAGVHRNWRGGIVGTQATGGAESICLSGGYEDDRDYGDVIYYTGWGGRNEKGQQVQDQKLTSWNLGLAHSSDKGIPIRVLRGFLGDPAHSPDNGFRYDGLYTVTSWRPVKGKRGFQVWEYRLERQREPTLPHEDPESSRGGVETEPSPDWVWTQRRVRDTNVGRVVKKWHDDTCQICGLRIALLTGAYSEAAHIRPLGSPHDGPDVSSNVLCLCPNCHVRFDRLTMYVDSDLTIRDTKSGRSMGELRQAARHAINLEQLAYQKSLCPSDLRW